jgi:large subunit ribosomal protein L35
MPKMKTHSGAKKRFKLTGTGKVKFKRANMRHILTKHSSKVKRKLRQSSTLCAADAKTVKRLLRKIS